MAGELTLSLTGRFSKGSQNRQFSSGRLSIDVTGVNAIDNVQNIGTSEEAITLAEAGAGGYMIVHNLDATNYVSLRRATGEGNFCRVNAGEWAIFRLEAAAPFAIANTSACNVRFIIIPA